MTKKTRQQIQQLKFPIDTNHARNLFFNLCDTLRRVTDQPYEYSNIQRWLSRSKGLLPRPLAPNPLPAVVERIFEAFLDDFPYTFKFLEHVCDHTNEKDVLKAIDSALGNLDFIDVFIEEQFHQENVSQVAAVRELPTDLQEKALQQIWEEKLCTRYNSTRISIKLTTGSVRGEYHVPLSTLIPFAFSQIANQTPQNITISKLKVTLPPSLALPLAKPLSAPLDVGVLRGIVKSTSTIDLSHRNTLRTCLIDEFGIHRDVVERILPQDTELLQSFSLAQHVERYIDEKDLQILGVDAFATSMRLQPESRVCVELCRFFLLCNDVMSPAAWFIEYITSCFTHIQGVLPDGWENGQRFMTLVNPSTNDDLILRPIPAIYWNRAAMPSLNALVATLGIDMNQQNVSLMFHANTLRHAKDIVGGVGIHPRIGRPDRDFGLGFYLTPEYGDAVVWATTHHGYQQSAVVIYMVPGVPPPNILMGIDLSEQTPAVIQQWETLVLHYRRKLGHPQVALAELRDWIYGLQASYFESRDRADPAWVPRPRAGQHFQLTLKSWAAALTYNTFAVGMVIFPASR